ncbi:tetratricopeptide repeat protein [Hyalangium gracile]|uniref:tetratricopeptide repeat protein n=1 Tax=Hyalangium gracile TaxID=394092 RepID=UPI001CCA0BFA|nr:tetratricopeptide repeat protein [Hyalangium gracile]
MGIKLNGDLSEAIYRRWPLVIEVSVYHPDVSGAEPVPPITIAAKSGEWHQFIKLEVLRRIRGQADVRQDWPLKIAGSPSSGSLVLDEKNPAGRLTLLMAVEDVEPIPVGEYVLTAWLDTRSGATDATWHGTVRRTEGALLQEEPTPLSEQEACRKARVQVSYYRALGQRDQSAAALDAFLDQYPASVESMCWGLRGELFEEAGNIDEAIRFYRRSNAAGAQQSEPTSDPHAYCDLPAPPYYQDRCIDLMESRAPPEEPLRDLCL